ncbi:ABC transporter substrate-binding protein [Microbacterium sp. YY-01]|uniref:ABC transporter substrate-binding protein n=1 Tax=Microbacterium sp. YY-01 TaxID=3421634 RepID=UPI003D164F96
MSETNSLPHSSTSSRRTLRTLRTRLVAALGAVTASALALTGCSAQAASTVTDADGLHTIRLLDPTEYTQMPLRYAEEAGIFADEGLRVEWVQTDDAIISTGSGDLTIAFGPTTTYLRAAAQGAPVRLVGAGFRTKGPFWLIADESISSIEELRGKKVGIAVPGSGLETYALAILQAHGIDPSEVTTVASGTNETAYGAVTTGQVDATIIHQPFAALGELEGTTATLARGWDYLPTYQTGALIASTTLIDSNPELLEKTLRAYYRAYDHAKDNYDDYVPWLITQLPSLNPDAVRTAIDREDVIWETNANLDLDAINDSQQLEIDFGHQNEKYDTEKYVDLRFIPEEFTLNFVYPDPKDLDQNNAGQKGADQ